MEEQNPRLSKREVLERLNLCESPEIVNQLYDYGLLFSKELFDRIKALETKAVSFAAYGAAIVSFLVATSAGWGSVGNLSSKWIAFFSGVCGLICNIYAVKALWLTQTETLSQDDWLNKKCLDDSELLQKARIVSLWGVINARNMAEDQKAVSLRKAQVWLTCAVSYLVFLLLQILLYTTLKGGLWGLVLAPRPIWITCWYVFVKTGWGFGCVCGLGFWIACRLSRRIV